MLSGISSQSPTPSTQNMNVVNMSTQAPTSLSSALGDNIFLGLQSLGMSNLMSEFVRTSEAPSGLFTLSLIVFWAAAFDNLTQVRFE